MTLQEPPHNLKDVQVRKHRWSGLDVHTLKLHVLPGRAWHQLSGDLPTLSIVVREDGGCCEARATLDQSPVKVRRSVRRRAGHSSLIPANSCIWGYSEDIDRVDEVRLMLDRESMSRLLGEEFSADELLEPSLMFFDEPLQILAGLIASHAPEMSSHSLLGDSLVVAMIARLASFGAVRPEFSDRRLGLTRSQIAAVAEYVRANLAHPIRLADLSELAGLSPSQFGRAFKVTTGRTPHQFHIDIRIERAMEMLADQRTSLADVALRTGFSDQSHFTRTFTAAQGVSPGRWRQERVH